METGSWAWAISLCGGHLGGHDTVPAERGRDHFRAVESPRGRKRSSPASVRRAATWRGCRSGVASGPRSARPVRRSSGGGRCTGGEAGGEAQHEKLGVLNRSSFGLERLDWCSDAHRVTSRATAPWRWPVPERAGYSCSEPVRSFIAAAYFFHRRFAQRSRRASDRLQHIAYPAIHL